MKTNPSTLVSIQLTYGVLLIEQLANQQMQRQSDHNQPILGAGLRVEPLPVIK